MKLKIKNFVQAEQFLALHIPKSTKQTFPGELGLKRAKYFLHLLGNPQEKLKIIHVAGTSGKGSTCYLINSLLLDRGFKVGFHQSPHLTDVTERFQINGKRISQKKFVSYLNKIIPMVSLVGKTFHGSLTYFEILVGLAYFIFYDKKIDYVVMETGLGGWYDATNVVERSDKLAVLTKIGLDHTNILGKSIEEITLQKAMIINNKSQVISIYQDPKAEKVMREVAEKKKAKIMFVRRDAQIGRLYNNQLNRLNLIGEYQKENASLALAAVNFLSKRDGFLINQEQVAKVFYKADFPGRFDVKKINGKTVVFDGAHNPQKMEAFIGSLIKEYPDKKFNFLIAFKFGKDYKKILKIITPWADSISLTTFFTENQDMINASENPEKIREELNRIQSDEIGFNQIKSDIKIIPDLEKAWKSVLKKKEPVVVTGSLYLIGEIYRLIKNN